MYHHKIQFYGKISKLGHILIFCDIGSLRQKHDVTSNVGLYNLEGNSLNKYKLPELISSNRNANISHYIMLLP